MRQTGKLSNKSRYESSMRDTKNSLVYLQKLM